MNFGELPIAIKLNIVLISAIVCVLGISGFFLSQWLSQRMEERSLTDLQRSNQQIVDMIDAYAAVLEQSTQMLAAQFTAGLPRQLSLDGSHKQTSGAGEFASLRAGEQLLNNHNTPMDEFTAATGAVATVLVLQDEDFVRVATSLKDDKGKRALGTPLGAAHPAIPRLLKGQPYTGRATLFGRDYMTHYTPLKDGTGRVVGATFVGIDFTDGLALLKERILSLRIGATGYAFALDAGHEAGKAMIHPAAAGRNLLDARDVNGRPFIRDMLEMKQGIIRYPWMNAELGDKRPREKVTVFHHFAKWNWVVGSGSYLEEFTSDIRGMQIRFALTGLAVILMLMALIYYSTRHWLGTPLGKALQLTQRVAEGDLTVSIEAHNNDEVGQLLAATDLMCRKLRSMIGEVSAGVGTLSSGIGQMSAASHQVAASSGLQSEAATAMASAIEEMTVSIDHVAQLSQEARHMAEHSGRTSESGAAVIDSAIREMGHIAHTVRASSTAVAQLGEQSQQITHIVSVIRDIADQTSLLALNAAIEAARAGEQGRGFAVVADEVRKLAERTTRSTQEIAAMVEQIQTGAHSAVSSMKQGVSQVEGGVQLASEASGSMAQIKTSAGQVGEAVVGISVALHEQTSASQEIARNVENIAQQAEENHHQARQTSAAARDLESLAERLRLSIARFST